jgi:hypothetical protein
MPGALPLAGTPAPPREPSSIPVGDASATVTSCSRAVRSGAEDLRGGMQSQQPSPPIDSVHGHAQLMARVARAGGRSQHSTPSCCPPRAVFTTAALHAVVVDQGARAPVARGWCQMLLAVT